MRTRSCVRGAQADGGAAAAAYEQLGWRQGEGQLLGHGCGATRGPLAATSATHRHPPGPSRTERKVSVPVCPPGTRREGSTSVVKAQLLIWEPAGNWTSRRFQEPCGTQQQQQHAAGGDVGNPAYEGRGQCLSHSAPVVECWVSATREAANQQLRHPHVAIQAAADLLCCWASNVQQTTRLLIIRRPAAPQTHTDTAQGLCRPSSMRRAHRKPPLTRVPGVSASGCP